MAMDHGALALIDLVQDIDVFLPLLVRLHRSPDIRLRIIVSRWLAGRAPRIRGLLRQNGLPFEYVHRKDLLSGQAPDFNDFGAFLTASESTAGPHRWVHAATLRARSFGCATFTLQHGLDNLETFRPAHLGRVDFASDIFLTWGPQSGWPDDLAPETTSRLAAVGRPAFAKSPVVPDYDLGIFENLHATRYSDAERAQFMTGLQGLLEQSPDLRIYIQSHPAGGWLDQHAGLFRGRRNVRFTSSKQGRETMAETGSAVESVARVITTPSTIALDAAQSGRAVALALGGESLYGPLPVLSNRQSWIDWVNSPVVGTSNAFIKRHLMLGDAAARIERLLHDAL